MVNNRNDMINVYSGSILFNKAFIRINLISLQPSYIQILHFFFQNNPN